MSTFKRRQLQSAKPGRLGMTMQPTGQEPLSPVTPMSLSRQGLSNVPTSQTYVGVRDSKPTFNHKMFTRIDSGVSIGGSREGSLENKIRFMPSENGTGRPTTAAVGTGKRSPVISTSSPKNAFLQNPQLALRNTLSQTQTIDSSVINKFVQSANSLSSCRSSRNVIPNIIREKVQL